MKRLTLVVLLLVASFAAQPAMAEQSAGAFVKGIGAQAIQVLQGGNAGLAAREAAFGNLLKREFDLALIGRFALGRYWKQASRNQRIEYVAVFGDFVVKKYAALMGGYAGETLAVKGERTGGEKDQIVLTRIERPSGPPINAEWRVRKNDGRWRIIDISVEGISMAVTQRAEFKSVVQRNGVDGLIEVLSARVNKLGVMASNN